MAKVKKGGRHGFKRFDPLMYCGSCHRRIEASKLYMLDNERFCIDIDGCDIRRNEGPDITPTIGLTMPGDG